MIYETTEFDRNFQLIFKTTNDRFQYSNHIHLTFYEVNLFLRGNVSFVVEDTKKKLERGDLMIIPPNIIHRVEIDDNADYERIVLHLSESTLINMSTPATNLLKIFQDKTKYIYHLSGKDLDEYLNICDKVRYYTNLKKMGADIMLSSWLNILAITAASQKSVELHDDLILPSVAVQTTAQYISEHYSEQLSLQSIAESQNMSVSHLGSLFKDFYGVSIWNYVLTKRLIRSRELLLENCSVSVACEKSGFSDYAHFIKTFHKVYGISPAKFKKLAQAHPEEVLLKTIHFPT